MSDKKCLLYHLQTTESDDYVSESPIAAIGYLTFYNLNVFLVTFFAPECLFTGILKFFHI